MSQNDFIIANQTFPNFRVDLNDALQALASSSSGSLAPTTTYAYMLWYDTANDILKMRTSADDGWINLMNFDQGADTAVPSTSNVLDEDDFASNSATQPPSQQSTKAYVDGLKFRSAAQSYTNGGALTFAHGLPSAPTRFNVWLVCITADAGFSVGDVVDGNGWVSTSNPYNFWGHSDATNVTLRCGSAGVRTVASGGGLTPTFTPANWNVYVEAYL